MFHSHFANTHYTSDSIPSYDNNSLLFPLLLQIFIPGCCGVAWWIPILRLKKNNPSFVNTTGTFLLSLSSLSLTALTFSHTNSNEHVCPCVDTHRPYRLACKTAGDMNLQKSIVKMLSACHLMELKKLTTSHKPSLPEADKSFFSSLAFGIEFLQHLYYGWSMFRSNCKYVVCVNEN